MSESTYNELKKLSITVWKTSSARYNAALRLQRRELFSTISLAAFSATGIGVSVLQNIYQTSIDLHTNNQLTFISICLGLFILVFSLSEWGMRAGAKADALYNNAQKLNALQRSIDVSSRDAEVNHKELHKKFQAKYEKIKSRCQYNHSPLDYEYFLICHRHAKELSDASKYHFTRAAYKYVAWNLSSFWLYLASWILVGYSIWSPLSKTLNQ